MGSFISSHPFSGGGRRHWKLRRIMEQIRRRYPGKSARAYVEILNGGINSVVVSFLTAQRSELVISGFCSFQTIWMNWGYGFCFGMLSFRRKGFKTIDDLFEATRRPMVSLKPPDLCVNCNND